MGAPLDYTEDEVLSAIKDSAGIVSKVAENLGCTWGTADKYIKKYETALTLMAEECERILDLAESEMIKHIENGDIQMIKYILATKGKKRGYTEKQEIEHTGSQIIYLDKQDENL